MKVKKEINLEVLLNYGFTKIDKEEETEKDQYLIASYDYKYEIGHARRGQFYYLLVGEKTRDLIIYATEPDGSGESVICPDVLIQLAVDGVVASNRC
jgi:hypothetical protein